MQNQCIYIYFTLICKLYLIILERYTQDEALCICIYIKRESLNYLNNLLVRIVTKMCIKIRFKDVYIIVNVRYIYINIHSECLISDVLLLVICVLNVCFV